MARQWKGAQWPAKRAVGLNCCADHGRPGPQPRKKLWQPEGVWVCCSSRMHRPRRQACMWRWGAPAGAPKSHLDDASIAGSDEGNERRGRRGATATRDDDERSSSCLKACQSKWIHRRAPHCRHGCVSQDADPSRTWGNTKKHQTACAVNHGRRTLWNANAHGRGLALWPQACTATLTCRGRKAAKQPVRWKCSSCTRGAPVVPAEECRFTHLQFLLNAPPFDLTWKTHRIWMSWVPSHSFLN